MKNVRKIILNLETIRLLNNGNLKAVEGGKKINIATQDLDKCDTVDSFDKNNKEY